MVVRWPCLVAVGVVVGVVVVVEMLVYSVEVYFVSVGSSLLDVAAVGALHEDACLAVVEEYFADLYCVVAYSESAYSDAAATYHVGAYLETYRVGACQADAAETYHVEAYQADVGVTYHVEACLVAEMEVIPVVVKVEVAKAYSVVVVVAVAVGE